ncbi:MAG: Cu(I)-responsive transcriptional regulator [Pseudomonadales bacterium]
MNIGEAAKATGLPAKTIRYYEDIGLVSAERGGNGYRSYGERHLHRLAFLQRARSLGFSIDECRELLSLYDDRHRASADVKRIATEKVREIEVRMAALAAMRDTLKHLAEHCHGDARPDCPILDDLAHGPN